MTAATAILSAFLFACSPHEASSFAALTPRSTLNLQSSSRPLHRRDRPRRTLSRATNDDNDDAARDDDDDRHHHARSRRSVLRKTLLATAAATVGALVAPPANAALGTLPEFADTNAAFQSLTVDVTDKDQYDRTIAFFTNSFDGMKVLRSGVGGGVTDTWLGFGPETLSIPPTFTVPVSSLSQYGGHASLRIRYDPSSAAPLYKPSGGEFNQEPAAGDSVAFLQLGVPLYRISQMVKDGGNVIDAYGWVNVVSPSGLPVRGVVGIRADPMMFLAVNCEDVKKSEEFYAKLGFVRQEYPYARLNQGQGQFEPPQPKKSVYVAPSPNSMGILLLPNKRGKKVVTNPVVRSLNVVYAPPEGGEDDGGDGAKPALMDPSSLPISFVSSGYLEKEIKLMGGV